MNKYVSRQTLFTPQCLQFTGSMIMNGLKRQENMYPLTQHISDQGLEI